MWARAGVCVFFVFCVCVCVFILVVRTCQGFHTCHCIPQSGLISKEPYVSPKPKTRHAFLDVCMQEF